MAFHKDSRVGAVTSPPDRSRSRQPVDQRETPVTQPHLVNFQRSYVEDCCCCCSSRLRLHSSDHLCVDKELQRVTVQSQSNTGRKQPALQAANSRELSGNTVTLTHQLLLSIPPPCLVFLLLIFLIITHFGR